LGILLLYIQQALKGFAVRAAGLRHRPQDSGQGTYLQRPVQGDGDGVFTLWAFPDHAHVASRLPLYLVAQAGQFFG